MTTDDPAVRFPRLRRDDLPIDAVDLARFLIGKALVHASAAGTTVGRIVETEAYPVGDASSHAYRGPTARNGTMFRDWGHLYVFQIHRQNCLNVVAEVEGAGAAVLLRALEPLVGEALMAERRALSRARDLARGPGRLAAAMGIDRSYDGLDLCANSPVWLAPPAVEPVEIGRSVRIGISREIDRPLRFYEVGSAFLSGARRLSA